MRKGGGLLILFIVVVAAGIILYPQIKSFFRTTSFLEKKDPAIQKCENSFWERAEVSEQKWGVTISILKSAIVNESEARALAEQYKGLNELPQFLFDSGEIKQYPVVFIGAGLKVNNPGPMQLSQGAFTVFCDMNGQLTQNSLSKLS
jgi:hypothetical protein